MHIIGGTALDKIKKKSMVSICCRMSGNHWKPSMSIKMTTLKTTNTSKRARAILPLTKSAESLPRNQKRKRFGVAYLAIPFSAECQQHHTLVLFIFDITIIVICRRFFLFRFTWRAPDKENLIESITIEIVLTELKEFKLCSVFSLTSAGMTFVGNYGNKELRNDRYANTFYFTLWWDMPTPNKQWTDWFIRMPKELNMFW